MVARYNYGQRPVLMRNYPSERIFPYERFREDTEIYRSKKYKPIQTSLISTPFQKESILEKRSFYSRDYLYKPNKLNMLLFMILEDKKLRETSFSTFFDVILLKADIEKRVDKIYFYINLILKPSILNNIKDIFLKALLYFIVKYSYDQRKIENFNFLYFRQLCLNTIKIEIKHSIEIKEPENFYVSSKEDDLILDSQEALDFFLEDLENSQYDKKLADFYSKFDNKIKDQTK